MKKCRIHQCHSQFSTISERHTRWRLTVQCWHLTPNRIEWDDSLHMEFIPGSSSKSSLALKSSTTLDYWRKFFRGAKSDIFEVIEHAISLVSAISSYDSVNPSSAVEEEGLSSPPLDEGAFLTTQPTGMELAQCGMDDDGSEINSIWSLSE
ncbi:hypothetical protein ACLOJK_039197 [Asimina triloba]